MTLIYLENVSLAFGEAPLLDHIDLKIQPKERIFLIGRNGMGKSCLLKVIAGHLKVDAGKVHRASGLKIAELSQSLPHSQSATVFDVVSEGLQDIGILLKRFHELTHKASYSSESHWLKEMEQVQRELEVKNGWQYEQLIETILSQLSLSPDVPLHALSGGWQRRVALARALVSAPDLLLLDEPTNHLDLAAIEWLEDYLLRYAGAVLCITHDRALLRKLSQRILELDRGKLTSWVGDFDKFMADKEHRLDVEESHAKLFDKRLAQEEAWLRQGVKARRTRNEGRVTALKKLREERKLRRERQGNPKFSANDSMLSGELVIKAENISFRFQDKYLIKDFSINIVRGDKIALVGPNGIGKTTLLKILLGELQPEKGTVKLGTNLQIGYFDQLRSGINPELSVVENVAGGRETISVLGREKHIISYLSDFLFTPERARTPVKMLSGGECNRLLLAKLFSLPNNLLVLDEPTNDLDIESLELLESILVEYKGTLLIVSHDRTFIDEVSTSTLYFSGEGKIQEYIGGFKEIPKISSTVKETEAPKDTTKNQSKTTGKLSYKLKKELEEIPQKISVLEAKQQDLQLKIADSQFYNNEKFYVTEVLTNLQTIEKELLELYARWEELEK